MAARLFTLVENYGLKNNFVMAEFRCVGHNIRTSVVFVDTPLRTDTKPLQNKLERLSALDQLFRYRAAAPEGEAWFQVVKGDIPVLISAPHACMHVRDGVSKMQEEYTGAIALFLAELCGCHAVVTRYKTYEDPNWQSDSIYKDAIGSLVSDRDIRFCIDLHGMRNIYHMGVALGTINGNACDPHLVLPHFLNAGFRHVALEELAPDKQNAWCNVVVDHPKFTGGLTNNTVTRFVSQQLGIPGVQVELSSQARVVESAATDDWPLEYRGDPVAINASLAALQSLIVANA